MAHRHRAEPTRSRYAAHGLFLALLAAGAVLRVLTMVAYAPAFWYDGDSGVYISQAGSLYPQRDRGLGYPLLLTILEPGGTLALVAAVQHLAGLGIAVACYALLVRRGVGRTVAAIAAAPLLLDGQLVAIEHYILLETLLTVCLVAAVVALLWREQPGPLAAAVAGLALAAAWLTKPVALLAVAALGGYLLLRRLRGTVSTRAVVAFAAAVAVPAASLLAWVAVDGRPSVYSGGAGGIFLYGRTAMIADCATLELTPEQAALCPSTPLDQRSDRADHYIWIELTPEQRNDPALDPVFSGFARAVITSQPGDYAAIVARETSYLLLPWPGPTDGLRILGQRYIMPVAIGGEPGAPVDGPLLAGPDFQATPSTSAPPPTGLTRALHWYSETIRVPALARTAVILLVLVAVIRRRTWDAALLVGLALAWIVAQVAIAMFEERYAVVVLPLFCLAAGLAWSALRTVVVEQPQQVGPVAALGERAGDRA